MWNPPFQTFIDSFKPKPHRCKLSFIMSKINNMGSPCLYAALACCGRQCSVYNASLNSPTFDFSPRNKQVCNQRALPLEEQRIRIFYWCRENKRFTVLFISYRCMYTLSYRVSLVYSMCCGNPGLGNALTQWSEADHKCSLPVDPHVGPILSHTPLYPCLFLLYLSCFFLPPSFGIVWAEGNCGIKCSSILDHWICAVTQFIMCFQILQLFLNVKCAISFYVKILQIPICRNCSK